MTIEEFVKKHKSGWDKLYRKFIDEVGDDDTLDPDEMDFDSWYERYDEWIGYNKRRK